MKNNFVTWDMLNCPPPELKCILEKLICALRFTALNNASPDNAVAGDKYLKINAAGEIVISTT